MRKIVFMLLCLVFFSASVGASPWFNITDAYIQQLDHDSYRIQVFVDFGGTNFITPSGTESTGDFYHFTHDSYRIQVFVDFGGTNFITPSGTESTGDFYHFTFGPLLGTSQYNPTIFDGSSFASYLPGDYTDRITGGVQHNSENFIGGFGYDFDISEPFADPAIDLSYSASFYGGTWTDELPEYTGTFTATVIPEPGTLLLVGLGLTGAGLIRRKVK